MALEGELCQQPDDLRAQPPAPEALLTDHQVNPPQPLPREVLQQPWQVHLLKPSPRRSAHPGATALSVQPQSRTPAAIRHGRSPAPPATYGSGCRCPPRSRVPQDPGSSAAARANRLPSMAGGRHVSRQGHAVDSEDVRHTTSMQTGSMPIIGDSLSTSSQPRGAISRPCRSEAGASRSDGPRPPAENSVTKSGLECWRMVVPLTRHRSSPSMRHKGIVHPRPHFHDRVARLHLTAERETP